MANDRNGPLSPELQRRVLIENVSPQVDGGLYPSKRVLGDRVLVTCDLVVDGHTALGGALRYRPRVETEWRSVPLESFGNDEWRAAFVVDALGTWEFTVDAWVDAYTTWQTGTAKKLDAGQPIGNELAVGAHLLAEAATRAAESEASALREAAAGAANGQRTHRERFLAATDAAVAGVCVSALVARYPDPQSIVPFGRVLTVTVDPPRARFSSWYEMFPRSSASPNADGTPRHGTLKDCASRLPYVASMGFDVLYLPPIHPIGLSFRKGPNNALEAKATDVGSPWAIGAREGGHTSVHPSLGTLEDFRALVRAADRHGIDVAIDIAFQASPDHPYLKDHPEWFLKRADGTIQYAENPPKKYQDVHPFDFDSPAWQALWNELLGVFLFWAKEGVRIFRVDNPHTKPLRFWQWCLAEVKSRYADAIFLAEAFTRPKVMYALAKVGFTQSYTYFTWRHTKTEFTQYLTELTRPPVSDFYRPNFWTNTPDILPEHLQYGGRATFVQRLVLAATLSSNFGIYGPAFELMEHIARPGSEEYIDNEKYEVRTWPIEREDSLRDTIARVNRIRRENLALQDNRITFHPCDNPQLLCFSKRDLEGTNVVIVVVNLDVHHVHSGWLELDLPALGLLPDEAFQAHDLLADARYAWRGARAYVEIDPNLVPASIFRVRRKIRSEQDFEYFL